MSTSSARPGALRTGLRLAIVGALLALSLGIVPAASAASLAKFPGSSAAVSGTWTNAANASADDGAYATADVARSSTSALDYGSFGFDSIPVGATITSATLEIQFRVGNNAGTGTVSAQARVSGSASGTAASSTAQPTTDTIISTSNLGITSRSQLLDGTFAVRVATSRGNTGANGVVTTYLDYVKVTVVYSVPDTTPPVVTVPANMTVEATGAAGAAVTFSASAADAIDGPLTPTCTPASGSTFPLGTTTVTCTATDAAGNTGSAGFTVTVVDTTPPAVTVPANVTTAATSPAGATVSYGAASATDAVSGSRPVSCTPASGSLFPVGTTTVTCSATDAAGNTGSAGFTVTVVDTTAPDLVVPADITEEATGPAGAKVTYTVSADDAVDAAVAVSCSRSSGAMFALGTTTVTCTATDAAGNTTGASFDVTVVDTTPPDLTVPPDVEVPATGPNGAVVTYDVTAVDLVDGDVTPTCSPASGSLFPVGTTTVTCTATDAAGNGTGDAGAVDESGSYSFVVTVAPYDGPVPSTPPTATEDAAGAASTGLPPFVGLWIAGAAGLFAILAAAGWRRRDQQR